MISEDTIFAASSTDYLFRIHVASSKAGTGCILVQHLPVGKRLTSVNSRILEKAQQKCLPFTKSFAE